jgi:Bacterial Ig domain
MFRVVPCAPRPDSSGGWRAAKWSPAAFALALFLGACGSPAAPPQIASTPAAATAQLPDGSQQLSTASVSDASSGGNPRFYWVTNRGLATFPGVLDTALSPSVKICKVVNNVVTTTCPVPLIAAGQLTLTPDAPAAVPPTFGFWRGRWDSKNPALNVNDDYRVSVMVGAQLLGYQDVDLVSNSNETKTPRAGFIAIVNGSSLDFKFRIEVGATSPNVALTPSSLSFPTVFVGTTSSAKTVTIKNVGVGTLALSGVSISGANPGDFAASLSGCASLAPQASCTLTSTFRPSALGPRGATLTLNSPGGALPQMLALTGGTTAQVINRPPTLPHSIIAFPVRDYVFGAGYAPTDRVTVSILRPDPADATNQSKYRILSMVHGAVPTDDPGTPEFDGQINVNHPGGECWEIIVPDIRAGDIVRMETAPGVGDETYVQNVLVTIPGTTSVPATLAPGGASNADGSVVIHGRAMDLSTGQRLPLTQFEARLIAKGNAFNFNGKRAIRAGGAGKDGTLVYDTADLNNGAWTATFTGLIASDLVLAEASESRALWLGRVPGTLSELTIYEFGQFPGFGGGCTGPVTGFAGPLAAPAPASLIFNEQGLFDPADPAANPASPAQVITVSNGGGAVLAISDVTLTGPAAADFLIEANACLGANVAPGGRCTVNVRFRPSSGGPRDALLNFVDSADNTPQSVALTGNLNSVAPGPVHEPPVDPHALFVFPSRDFISALGYGPNDRVKIEVLRGGATIGVANNVVPKDDLSTPGFDGLVDVNHPGAACWEGTTPDIRPGDVVRYTTNFGVVDQTTTQNLYVTQPATQGRNPGGSPASSIVMTGVALGQDGLQIPLAQFEARIIAKGSTFAGNGRRSLRASVAAVRDGNLSYVSATPTDGRWIAVFPNLSQADIDLASSVESRGVWLGRVPAALTESTIYEYGLSGGPVGCAAPLNVPSLTPTPSALGFGSVPQGSTTAPKSVTLTVTGPSNIASVSVAGIDPGEFTVNPGTCLGNVLGSCSLSVTFTPGGLGTRSASVQIVDNADGSPHSVLVSGLGVAAPPPNRPPLAGDDYATEHAGRPVTLNVLSNDSDPDGDTLSVMAVDSGTTGVASCTAGGSCTYTPNSGFLGTAFFAYTVSDGRGGTDTATVTITYTNGKPVGQPDDDRTDSAHAVGHNVLSNDSDPDTDSLSLSSFGQGSSGSVSCTPSGDCSYTPNAGFSGSDAYSYTLSDGFESATARVNVVIDPVAAANPDGPVSVSLASFDPATGFFISAATLLANDAGRNLVITGASNSSGGSTSCNASGCTFSSGNTGAASFTYFAVDAYGNTASATVDLMFTP